MKWSLFSLLAISLASTLSFAAHSNELGLTGEQEYKAVIVNGKRYFAPVDGAIAQQSRRVDGLSASKKWVLKRGDKLRSDALGPILKVSGMILVEASDEQAKVLASRYDLTFRTSSGGIALLEAQEGVDLNAITTKLKRDGVNAEVELAGRTRQPQ